MYVHWPADGMKWRWNKNLVPFAGQVACRRADQATWNTAANALLVIRCYSAVPRLKRGEEALHEVQWRPFSQRRLLFSRARQINSAARRDRVAGFSWAF